jgi:hypothetical protein
MQPAKLSISELFQQREQYLIPLFQRGYVWTLTYQIQPLWEDIIDRVDALLQHRTDAMKVGSVEKLKPLRKHFLGAIIVGGPISFDTQIIGTREVIDGQQRITTLQLMLLALRDVLKPYGDASFDDDVNTLTYNRGTYHSKSDHLKVWPTNVGRDVVQAIASLGDYLEVCKAYPARGPNTGRIERPLMVQAYLFFYAMLACFLRGKRFDDSVDDDNSNEERTISHAVIRSIEKDNILRIPFFETVAKVERARPLIDALQICFQIMRLQLDAEDDPQIIFETLNARGTPLQPSDLVRNFLFLKASRNGEDVRELYDAYWKNFDEKPEPGTGAKGAKFWKKEERQGRLKNSRLDLLLYHYVGLRKRDDLKVAHVFEEFKEWWEGETRETNQELERLTKLARCFETFVAPDQKTRFGLFCRRMKLLDTATQTPLVFHLLEHYPSDSQELITAIMDIESYVVRRFVCGKTTKAYNRIFLGRLLAEMVSEGQYNAIALRQKLIALEGDSQAWPSNQEFETAWSNRQLYQGRSTQKVRAILEALEITLRTSKQEFMPELDSLSVEHVLPQGWKLEDYPLTVDNAETREMRKHLIHCIGNLTLVTQGFNSSLSNEPFRTKRPEISANSSLMLNAYFQRFNDADPWNEDAIVARAKTLFPLALKIWPRDA